MAIRFVLLRIHPSVLDAVDMNKTERGPKVGEKRITHSQKAAHMSA